MKDWDRTFAERSRLQRRLKITQLLTGVIGLLVIVVVLWVFA